MDLSFAWTIALGVTAVAGTFAWLTVLVTGLVFVARMAPEVRAAIPPRLWVAWGAAAALSVIWPCGLLASVVVTAVAGYELGRVRRGELPDGARPAALAALATGLVFLGLIAALVAIAIGMTLTT